MPTSPQMLGAASPRRSTNNSLRTIVQIERELAELKAFVQKLPE